MSKEEYIERYKEMLNAYFQDQSSEGKLTKHYTLREMEFVLQNIFSMSENEIREIHDDLYWKNFEVKAA